MNRKQKIIVSITGIFLVLMILVGLTYAYFLTQITGNTNTKSISVTTANLVLEYGENTNVVQGIENAEPGYEVSKIFTATNKGNSDITYGVTLENIVNELSRQQDLVYTLACTSYLKEGFSLSSNGTLTGTEDGTCNGVGTEKQFPSTSSLSVITTNTIDTTHIHVYKLTVSYKEMGEDQSEDMNKTFSAKVNIVDLNALTVNNPYKNDTDTLKKIIIDNAMFRSNGTEFTENPKTIPSQATSLENEKELSTTSDDYGTSYYYRGNVQDNYLNFAGMCFKIVRIEGDGSTKLILEDGKVECNSSSYTGNWSNGDTVAFGYDSAYKADFLNYSGGLADSLKNFQNTLETKLETGKSLSDYLKIDDWCFEHDVVLTNDSGVQYYGAYKRIYTDRSPSLKCAGTKLNKYKNNSDMYVGTLTVDEISFAGANNFSDCKHYLCNTYADKNLMEWWTISPSDYYFSYDDAFIVTDSGATSTHNVDDIDYIYSRAAVTLKSSILIKSGDGTQNNPYIIE